MNFKKITSGRFAFIRRVAKAGLATIAEAKRAYMKNDFLKLDRWEEILDEKQGVSKGLKTKALK
jgi:glutathionyl-hydroquinone reductase